MVIRMETRGDVRDSHSKVVGRHHCDSCGQRRKVFEYGDEKRCYECIAKRRGEALKDVRKMLGTSIRVARLRVPLTQRALAEKLDVCRETITNLENGKYNISVDTLFRVFQEVGLDMKVKLK